MYKVIFKLGSGKRKESIICHDGFPHNELFKLLKDGYDFIVISTFSNTIKIPYLTEENGEEWIDFKEYSFSKRSYYHGPDTYLNYFLSI
jgi:hypothetical protein